MANNNKFRKNKILALLLSALMVSSTAIALGSCKDNTGSNNSDPEDKPESNATQNTQIIKNGDFEDFNSNDELTVIGESVSGWSLSYSTKSKASSGTVDFTQWKDLTGSKYENPDDVKNLSTEDAIAAWDTLTTRDKLAFYEEWKSKNSGGKISKDFSAYQAFNIDLVDVPEDLTDFDAKTHDGKGLGYEAAEGETAEAKVLMIHNENPKDGSGTRKESGTNQKFTSSTTVTVPAGAAAEFSVWVRTANLRCTDSNGNGQDAVGKGAYIQVNHSVGGTSLPVYEVKNIDTENMTLDADDNGWAQYTFYLRGSSYTASTFSLVLGLGQGDSTNQLYYVNGYAFFDDIECEIVPADDAFNNKINAIPDKATFSSTKEEKSIDLAGSDKNSFVLDFHGAFQSTGVLENATTELTKSDDGKYTSGTTNPDPIKPAPFLDGGFDTQKDVAKVFTDLETLKNESNGYIEKAVEKYFKDVTFAKDSKTLVLYSAQGAAYTTTSSYDFKFTNNSVYSDYLAVSFFVRTSDLNGAKGAGISLVYDGETVASFDSLDTTNITPVEIGEDSDVYDGWQQCFFFVKNDTENSDATFQLKFSLGPTEITRDTTKADGFKAGAMAAFTKVEYYSMSKKEYESVSAGSYAKLVSLTVTEEDKAAGNSGFDSAKGVPSNALEKGLANPKNYKGVYNDSYYVNPPTSTSGVDEENENKYTSINQNQNAGLINREYFTAEDGYYNTATGVWMDGIKKVANEKNTDADSTNDVDMTNASEVWKNVFGNATQPLFIWNDNSAAKPYGFIGNETTISANTYSVISLKVKTNATASVYLIDTKDDQYNTTLSLGTNLTYWYDDDGNILTGDPEEKETEIAFYLGKDGLYTPNTEWSKYASLTEEQKSAKFANLANYDKDDDGNLILGENGASHKYNNSWKNVGENGIAFYANGGKYYAHRVENGLNSYEYKTLVSDLKTVTDLAKRYESTESEFKYTVTDTKGEWVTVTFYIHTADEAKTYRLEVWSGDREATTGNAKDTYVMFDTNAPGSAETNFNNLSTQYKDVDKDSDGEVTARIESVFSYFDSHNYLRYNEELDENGVGNVYKESYVASKQEKGVAYMKIEDGKNLTVLADYKYAETKVDPTEEEVDTDDNNKDDSTSDSSTNNEPLNPWLLASSISVAGVLVLAIVSIVVQKIVKKARKNRK